VTIGAGGSAYIDITIYTRKNPAGKQEFTSCGEYPLNEGAEIAGYDIISNSLTVTAICDCCDGECEGDHDDCEHDCDGGKGKKP